MPSSTRHINILTRRRRPAGQEGRGPPDDDLCRQPVREEPGDRHRYDVLLRRLAAHRPAAGGPLSYFVGDNLGSTSLTTNSYGVEIGRQKYFPYGSSRFTSGTLKTDYRFTGQRSEEVNFGSVYDYGARFYSPILGKFLSPDTIIPAPGHPQSLNRYAYTANNPLRYTDPTGHYLESALDIAFILYDVHDIAANGLNLTSGLSLVADVAGLVLPAVTGGGLLVRTLAHADDVTKAVSHVDDIVKGASHADELVKAAAKADDVAKAASHVDEARKTVSRVDNMTDVAKGVTGSETRGGVYTLRDAGGNVQRSGRTNDLARREVEHARSYPDLTFQPEFRSDNHQVQRGAEQILHDSYKPPLNKIQPISPRNPRRNQYISAARKAGMK